MQHFGANVSRRSAYTGASRGHEAEYHAVMSREVFPEGFEGFVQRASRSSDNDLAMDFTVRDLAAEKREAQKQAKLRAAIEREREAAAERKAEREMNATVAFAIERELRDRGVRTISRDDIVKINARGPCGGFKDTLRLADRDHGRHRSGEARTEGIARDAALVGILP